MTSSSPRPRAPRHGADDTDALVTALLTASRVLVGISAISLAEVEEKLTLAQFRTLVVLDPYPAGTNLNSVADALDVQASTAVRMIDRLVAAGLVSRRENPVDRREVLLSLTPDAAELVDRVTRRRRNAITKVVKAMAPTQRTRLVSALRAFAAAAGEPLPHVDDAVPLGW